MENQKKSKNCSFLKAIDKTGVPITLNWKHDNVHRTRCGGVFSIVGFILVGSFVFGTIFTFFQFTELKSVNWQINVDVI